MLQHHRKIDCVVRVVTPENIEFEYMLAGPFQRVPAYLVDYALRASIFISLMFIGALAGMPIGASGPLLVTVGLLSFFALSWLYGMYMESHFNGRTVGKMVCSLRVISADGRPINASQAALRNLLRLCDFAPPLTLTLLIPNAPALDLLPTCLVGLVAMTLTTRMQRVGDMAANTMVVWEGRKSFNTNLQPDDARAFALAELIPPTFQVSRTLARATALYMERRTFISVQRREELAGNLAQPLLKQFQMRADTSADLLLCAIYVRIYQSEEQRLAKIAAARKSGQLPGANRSNSVLVSATARPAPAPQVRPPASPVTSQPVQPVTVPAASQVLTAEVITADVIPATVVVEDTKREGMS